MEAIVRQQTECSICQDVYTNPKCLPCLHTFCCKCLADLRLSASKEQKVMSCPLCRKPFTIPANDDFGSLPTNFYMENIQDLIGDIAKLETQFATSKNSEQTLDLQVRELSDEMVRRQQCLSANENKMKILQAGLLESQNARSQLQFSLKEQTARCDCDQLKIINMAASIEELRIQLSDNAEAEKEKMDVLLQEQQVNQQLRTEQENERLQFHIRESKRAGCRKAVALVIVNVAVIAVVVRLVSNPTDMQIHEDKSSNADNIDNCELETFRFVEEILRDGAIIVQHYQEHRELVENALRNKLAEIFKNCEGRKEEQVIVINNCENGEKVRKRELPAIKNSKFWTNEKGKASKPEHSETFNYVTTLIGDAVIGLIAFTCCSSCCCYIVDPKGLRHTLATGRTQLQYRYRNYSRRNRRGRQYYYSYYY